MIGFRQGRRTMRLLGALGTALVVSGLSVAPAHAEVTVSSTPDQSWRVNGRVYATVVVGDTVFVGGQFTTATSPGGQTAGRRNIAAFSMDTGALLTSWRADAGSTVRALDSDGTSLWVGGAFGAIGGQTHARLAKVSVSTGVVDAGFTARLDNTARTLELDGGSLFVGGTFLTVDGLAKNRVAKLSAATGALDTRFEAAASGDVYAIKKSPVSSTVYLAGNFAALNGTTRNGVGAVGSDTGAVTGPAFGTSARPTLGLDIDPTGTRLYGAGGTATNTMAAWDTATGIRVWRVVTDGDIQATKYYGGTVYFGFHDGYQGNAATKLLAADAMTGAVDPTFRPRFDSFWGVFAIDAVGAGIVAGGEFTSVSGVPAQGFSIFRSSGTPNVPPSAAFTAPMHDLTGSFDGTGSSDSDGRITDWAWSFGDGDTGSGSTATHTYGTAGSYPVTLTVTDDDGATSSTTSTVDATAPTGGDPTWTQVGSGITEGISGMAATPSGGWVVVRDNKAAGENRLALLSAGGVVTPLTWPGTPPQDLEAIDAWPGQPGRYVALTSGGSGRVVSVSGTTVSVISSFTLPTGRTEDEGFALTRIDNTTVAVWGERGSTTTAGHLYAATFNVSAGTFGAVSQATVAVPYPTTDVRQISDTKLINGRIVISSSADPGDDGPFDSALYDVGQVSLSGGRAQLGMATPRSLGRFDGHKVEGIACSGSSGLLGSDDENLGGWTTAADFCG